MTDETNLQTGYHVACGLAVKQFEESDPRLLSRLCRAEYDAGNSSILLNYLGQACAVRWPSGKIERLGCTDEIPITSQVLILNYILSANGQQPTGELIAFRDTPSAGMYEPSFQKRAVNPLVRTFDAKPDLLLAAAERLGGSPAQVADTSVMVPVLPLLPVTYGIWHSDDEFPAAGVILFDASARKLLSTECLVVAASNGVYELMKVARTIG